MKAKIRHVGFIVSDIQKSIKFLENFFSFKKVQGALEQGDFISHLVGVENAAVEWVKLESDDCFTIELLQYRSHPNAGVASIPQIGATHIAITVTNIDSMFEILSNDFDCTSPKQSPDDKVKAMYCYGPPGIVVELVEEL